MRFYDIGDWPVKGKPTNLSYFKFTAQRTRINSINLVTNIYVFLFLWMLKLAKFDPQYWFLWTNRYVSRNLRIVGDFYVTFDCSMLCHIKRTQFSILEVLMHTLVHSICITAVRNEKPDKDFWMHTHKYIWMKIFTSY